MENELIEPVTEITNDTLLHYETMITRLDIIILILCFLTVIYLVQVLRRPRA